MNFLSTIPATLRIILRERRHTLPRISAIRLPALAPTRCRKVHYGTADQGGNVWEWTEAYGKDINGNTNTSYRIRRGGAVDTDDSTINSSLRETAELAIDRK